MTQISIVEGSDRPRPGIIALGGHVAAPAATTPLDVARQALVQIARLREVPTPTTYCRTYHERANESLPVSAICDHTRALADVSHRLLAPLCDRAARELPGLPERAREIVRQIDGLDGPAELDTAGEGAGALGTEIRDRLLRGQGIEAQVADLLGVLAGAGQGAGLGDGIDDGSAGVLEALLTRGIEPETLAQTVTCLRGMIERQVVLRRAVTEAQRALKAMLAEIVREAGELVASTADHEREVARIAQIVEQTDDPLLLRSTVGELRVFVRDVSASMRHSREAMVDSQQRLDATEREIATLRRQLADTSDQARHDGLTGVMNRVGFNETWQRELETARTGGEPLSLAILDIDDFKRLNDTYGHKTGDDVLVHVVTVIRGALRGVDAVSRFGGEEFVVLLPATDAQGAKTVLERLQRDLTRRFFLHNNERVLVTFSAGVTPVRPDDDVVDVVVARADRALYVAKRAGKNRVCIG